MKVEISSRAGAIGPSNHDTLKPATKPNMKDYDLTRIGIDRADNGVIVNCSYKMKPEAALKATKGKDYLDYDQRNPDEKHVFDDMSAAAEFIEGRLTGKIDEKADED